MPTKFETGQDIMDMCRQLHAILYSIGEKNLLRRAALTVTPYERDCLLHTLQKMDVYEHGDIIDPLEIRLFGVKVVLENAR